MSPGERPGPAGKIAPGPAGHAWLGALPALRRDPLAFLRDAARAHGDVVRYRIGPPGLGTVAHLLARPDHVRVVLQERTETYPKNVVFTRLGLGSASGLLTSEGAQWARQRGAAQPAFHRDRLEPLSAGIVERTEAMLEGWARIAPGSAVDVGLELGRLSLLNVAAGLLGIDARAEAGALLAAIEELIAHFKATVDSPLPFRSPLPLRPVLRAARAYLTLSGFAQRALERRRRGPDREDLLALLMASRHERTGAPLGDRQLRVEMMTFLLAGFETTAVALCWALHLLGRHPGPRRRWLDEVDRVAGDRPPRAADLASLGYGRMVIDEAMRLYPPSWSIERKVARDDVIDGYRIPAGGVVVLSPYLIHRSSAHWESPDSFDPERFAPERASARPKHVYFPFGLGPRACIGAAFATMHAQLVLATVSRRFELEPAGDAPVEPEPIVTLRPRGGLRMRLRRRG